MSSLWKMLGPSIPRPLVSAPAWARIGALAARLPVLFCWGIFETRLRAGEDRVDVLVCTSKWEGGREAVTAVLGSATSLPALGSSRPLFEAWVKEGNPIFEEVPLIWLEYDLIPDEERDPFVQFCVDRGYPKPGPSPFLSSSRVRELALLGLGPALGGRPDPASLDTLARSAELLPEGGRILHLGAMPQRGTRDLRVLASVPLRETVAWLDAIGWPGSRKAVIELLELIGPRFSCASVQLDMGEVVRPKLAVEFQLVERPGPDSDWGRFVDRLIALGICDPEKGRAALDWIGDETYDLPDASWLINIERQLDIKLVLDSSGAVEAKAYLGFHPRFVLS